MRSAPASNAPCTALRPTPPQPITTTLLPGSTRAVLVTAPTPVITEQPTRHARSSGMSDSNRYRARFRHHRILGEAGGAGHVMDVLTVAVQAHGAVVHDEACRFDAVAEHRTSHDAVMAVAAVGAEVEDHVITGLRPRDPGADLLHHAGAFVPEHDRQRHRPLALHHVIVGVAHAGRGHAHEHLAVLRVVELQGFDLERFVGFVENRCLHLHGLVSDPCLSPDCP